MTNPKSPGDRSDTLAPYEREARALREKTARLKALRLAKEAATPTTAAAKTASKTATKPASGKRTPAKAKRDAPDREVSKASLAEWLRQEEAAGRKP